MLLQLTGHLQVSHRGRLCRTVLRRRASLTTMRHCSTVFWSQAVNNHMNLLLKQWQHKKRGSTGFSSHVSSWWRDCIRIEEKTFRKAYIYMVMKISPTTHVVFNCMSKK